MLDQRQAIQASHRPAPAGWAVLLATFGLLSAAPVLAAQSNAPRLKEIVVTATRRAEPISKVPMSISALSRSQMDMRGISDIEQLARFIPGIHIDDTGTHNIAIRGIANDGGSGTTGIYINDTPIQMRALAFDPDEALPVAFDLQRIEVLRGPQGTLFGAGSEGGTVRYITTPASLTRTSLYSKMTVEDTQGGAPGYEAGVAAGTPIISGRLGIRADLYYRHEGGYVNLINPVTLASVQHNANYVNWKMFRLEAVWKINDTWTARPSFMYQSRNAHNTNDYWPLYSNPGNNNFVSADPDLRQIPDKFYLPALRISGNFGSVELINNVAYYHRQETSGYEGTLYNLGFYQNAVFFSVANNLPLLLDASGVHLPAGATNYRAPATVDNGQQNLVEEIRLQSNNPNARLMWTTGLFFSRNRQTYLEQIHDPLLNELTQAYLGTPYTCPGTNFQCPFYVYNAVTGADLGPLPYDPRFPYDSYFLQTHSTDTQYAWYGQATYAFTHQWKLTVGLRESHVKYTFNTLTGGPQLFLNAQTGSGSESQNAFTPKVSIAYQMNPNNLFYATYAKGFRPGGANNPVPYAACATDFKNFGIQSSPQTFSSDTVDSFEVGAKNRFAQRVSLSTSAYYIKWNNIQQTVVPPICQISFSDNLGSAVVKGVDLQAELLLTSHLTANLTAGYTDARFTRSAGFPGPPPVNLVVTGEAITGESGSGTAGTPTPPVTVSLGLQYDFRLFNHSSFLRMDDEYTGANHWLTPQLDPASAQYDPAYYQLGSTNLLSMRGGMRFGDWRIEAFVNNLTDTHALTGEDWSVNPGVCAANGTVTPACERSTRLQDQYTFRPRTFGLTAIFRY